SHVAASPDLQSAKVPRLCSRLITACLSPDLGIRYRGFENAMAVLDPDSRRLSVYPTEKNWTRRRAFYIAAGAACAISGAAAWEWNEMIDGLLHPLPQKRF